MRAVTKLASIDDLLGGGCGEVAPGDVFAFNGSSKVDQLIQDATRSAISHVGIVIRDRDKHSLLLLEATGRGVTATPLDEALEGYKRDHTCFYLPLAPASRALVVPSMLTDYYASNARSKYNYYGVIAAGLYDLYHPFFDRLLTHFHEKSPLARMVHWWEKLTNQAHRIWVDVFGEAPAYRRLFCSQLVCEVLQAMHVVYVHPPAGLVVPVEVCWFGIYAGAYQLNGDRLIANPFGWSDAPSAPRRRSSRHWARAHRTHRPVQTVAGRTVTVHGGDRRLP